MAKINQVQTEKYKRRGFAYTPEKGFSWYEPTTGNIVYGERLPEFLTEDVELMKMAAYPGLEGGYPGEPETLGLEEVPSSYLSAGRMWMPPADVAAFKQTEWQKWQGQAAEAPAIPSTPGQAFQMGLREIQDDWDKYWEMDTQVKMAKANAILDPDVRQMAIDAVKTEGTLERAKWKSSIEMAEAKFDKQRDKPEFTSGQLYQASDKVLAGIREKLPTEITEVSVPEEVPVGAPLAQATVDKEGGEMFAQIYSQVPTTFWGKAMPSEDVWEVLLRLLPEFGWQDRSLAQRRQLYSYLTHRLEEEGSLDWTKTDSARFAGLLGVSGQVRGAGLGEHVRPDLLRNIQGIDLETVNEDEAQLMLASIINNLSPATRKLIDNARKQGKSYKWIVGSNELLPYWQKK